MKSKGERERLNTTKHRFTKDSTERQEGLLQWTVYKQKKTTEMERQDISSGKLEMSREQFAQGWVQ